MYRIVYRKLLELLARRTDKSINHFPARIKRNACAYESTTFLKFLRASTELGRSGERAENELAKNRVTRRLLQTTAKEKLKVQKIQTREPEAAVLPLNTRITSFRIKVRQKNPYPSALPFEFVISLSLDDANP